MSSRSPSASSDLSSSVDFIMDDAVSGARSVSRRSARSNRTSRSPSPAVHRTLSNPIATHPASAGNNNGYNAGSSFVSPTIPGVVSPTTEGGTGGGGAAGFDDVSPVSPMTPSVTTNTNTGTNKDVPAAVPTRRVADADGMVRDLSVSQDGGANRAMEGAHDDTDASSSTIDKSLSYRVDNGSLRTADSERNTKANTTIVDSFNTLKGASAAVDETAAPPPPAAAPQKKKLTRESLYKSKWADEGDSDAMSSSDDENQEKSDHKSKAKLLMGSDHHFGGGAAGSPSPIRRIGDTILVESEGSDDDSNAGDGSSSSKKAVRRRGSHPKSHHVVPYEPPAMPSAHFALARQASMERRQKDTEVSFYDAYGGILEEPSHHKLAADTEDDGHLPTHPAVLQKQKALEAFAKNPEKILKKDPNPTDKILFVEEEQIMIQPRMHMDKFQAIGDVQSEYYGPQWREAREKLQKERDAERAKMGAEARAERRRDLIARLSKPLAKDRIVFETLPDPVDPAKKKKAKGKRTVTKFIKKSSSGMPRVSDQTGLMEDGSGDEYEEVEVEEDATTEEEDDDDEVATPRKPYTGPIKVIEDDGTTKYLLSKEDMAKRYPEKPHSSKPRVPLGFQLPFFDAQAFYLRISVPAGFFNLKRALRLESHFEIVTVKNKFGQPVQVRRLKPQFAKKRRNQDLPFAASTVIAERSGFFNKTLGGTFTMNGGGAGDDFFTASEDALKALADEAVSTSDDDDDDDENPSSPNGGSNAATEFNSFILVAIDRYTPLLSIMEKFGPSVFPPGGQLALASTGELLAGSSFAAPLGLVTPMDVQRKAEENASQMGNGGIGGATDPNSMANLGRSRAGTVAPGGANVPPPTAASSQPSSTAAASVGAGGGGGLSDMLTYKCGTGTTLTINMLEGDPRLNELCYVTGVELDEVMERKRLMTGRLVERNMLITGLVTLLQHELRDEFLRLRNGVPTFLDVDDAIEEALAHKQRAIHRLVRSEREERERNDDSVWQKEFASQFSQYAGAGIGGVPTASMTSPPLSAGTSAMGSKKASAAAFTTTTHRLSDSDFSSNATSSDADSSSSSDDEGADKNVANPNNPNGVMKGPSSKVQSLVLAIRQRAITRNCLLSSYGGDASAAPVPVASAPESDVGGGGGGVYATTSAPPPSAVPFYSSRASVYAGTLGNSCTRGYAVPIKGRRELTEREQRRAEREERKKEKKEKRRHLNDDGTVMEGGGEGAMVPSPTTAMMLTNSNALVIRSKEDYHGAATGDNVKPPTVPLDTIIGVQNDPLRYTTFFGGDASYYTHGSKPTPTEAQLRYEALVAEEARRKAERKLARRAARGEDIHHHNHHSRRDYGNGADDDGNGTKKEKREKRSRKHLSAADGGPLAEEEGASSRPLFNASEYNRGADSALRQAIDGILGGV